MTLDTNWGLIFAVVAAFGNLVWMLATLKIKDQISVKIEALKDWMDLRFVAAGAFTEYKTTVAVQHVELERRLTKLELAGYDAGSATRR